MNQVLAYLFCFALGAVIGGWIVAKVYSRIILDALTKAGVPKEKMVGFLKSL